MVNGIVSLTSLFDVSLLMYRNARDFFVLISYPVTLLHSLISSSNIPVESLEFSMYSICHLQIVSFTSSFLIWIRFISFSSLIAVARTSKTMLTVVVKVGTLVFFRILEEMISVFYH